MQTMDHIEEEDGKEHHDDFQNVPMSENESELEFKKIPHKSSCTKYVLLIVCAIIVLLSLAAFHYYQTQNTHQLPGLSTSEQHQQASAAGHQSPTSHQQTSTQTPSTVDNTLNNQPQTSSNSFEQQESPVEVEKDFNRIIWVQTDDELQAKQMEIAVTAQNFIHYAKEAGFDVRIVDNLNAYDWLSQEMVDFIKETHQKSKIDLPVYELLRLALLIEHGGVSVRFPNLILLQSLKWIEDLFENKVNNEDRSALSCQSKQIQVVAHHLHKEGNLLWFRDDFIAAKQDSELLKLLLNQIGKISKEGKWPYPHHDITTVNSDTLVVTLPGISQTLLNIFHQEQTSKKRSLCKRYHLQSFHEAKGSFMGTIPSNNASSIMKSNQKEFFQANGKKYLLRLTFSELVNDIANIIKTGDLNFGEGNSLLKNKLMMADGNKWLAKPKDKSRKVQLCIVSLKPQRMQDYQREMKEQIEHLGKQTFTNWNVVNFIEKYPMVSQKINQAMLVNASIYEGLNLQRAATKYCDPKSIMLLLDFDETLSTNTDLQKLAEHFESRAAFAAFFHLKTLNSNLAPAIVEREVRRRTNHPNRQLLNEIGNLMRAFTVESYRFIAPFDLRHSSGRYFDRELPLLSMLELCEHFAPCQHGNIVYQVRRLEEHMDLPRKKVITNITINTNRVKVADITRYEYFGKLRYRHICGTILFYQQYIAGPVEVMAVFNDGTEEAGLAFRKGMAQLIPRKIHQIWVRGEIPQFKKYLMQRLRDAHPDYQYFLWSEKNITRENFPQGYDLMQTLIEWDKSSPYNKMSVISDIIRSEAVHAHGGFYLDTNYMLFGDRPLDQFLTYAFVTAGELSPRQRMFRDTAIFGAVRESPRLARLISHRALSSRNFYSKRAAKQAGPGLFGRTLRGKEEQDIDVFQPGFEEFYPNFLYDPGNPNHNRCETPPNTPENDVLFTSNSGRKYLKNCSKIYPYAFGLDFFAEGLSWQKRKWR